MKFHTIKRNLIIAACVAFTLNAPVQAAQNLSEGSAVMSIGVGSVVFGSVIVAAASAEMVVESVEKTADGILLVLQGVGQGASEAGKFSIKITGDVAGGASLVVGQSVKVLAETTGSAIMASGKVIAFIPNEIGKSLMHHSRVEAQ